MNSLRKARRGFWAVLASLVSLTTSLRGGVHVTEPVPINRPRLTSDLQFGREGPFVASSGTNVMLTWSETAVRETGTNFSATNLFAVRINGSGSVEGEPRVAARMFDYNGRLKVFPAQRGFYGVFPRLIRRPVTSTSELMIGRYGSNGQELLAPVSIATNSYYGVQYDGASNGETFLVVWTGGSSTLQAVLVSPEGTLAPRIQLPLASSSKFGVTAVGRDYLVASGGQYGGVNVMRINAANGVNPTRLLLPQGNTFRAIGANGTNALVVARGPEIVMPTGTNFVTRFVQVRGDGAMAGEIGIAKPFPPDSSFNPIVAPDGDGWTVFDLDRATVPERLVNYHIKREGSAITVAQNVYPEVTFAEANYERNYTVTGIGPGRFIVAGVVGRDIGYQVIDASGKSEVRMVGGPLFESTPAVAASRDGYLTVWAERGTPRRVAGVRFRKDGTHVDAEPFTIAELPQTFSTTLVSEMKAAFNGKDYVVVWNSYDRSFQAVTGAARVAADGVPNVTAIAIDAQGKAFDLAVRDGSVFVAQQYPEPMLMWRIEPSSAVRAPVTLPAGGLAGDGARLMHFTAGTGNVVVSEVGPSGDQLQSSIDLGTGVAPVGVGRDGAFMFVWYASENSVGYAAGATLEKRGTITLPGAPLRFAAAASDFDFLVAVSLNKINRTNCFVRLDRATGAIEQTLKREPDEIDFLDTSSVASAGKDYLVVTTQRWPPRELIATQWVTTAALPDISTSLELGDTIRLTLELDPMRSYRIESSNDLIQWNFFKEESGSSTFTVGEPTDHPYGFFRAVLIAE